MRLDRGLLSYLRFHDLDRRAVGMFLDGLNPMILGRAFSVSRRYPGLDAEDVAQEMRLIALVALAKNTKFENDNSFLRFAAQRIDWKINDFIARTARCVKVPRHILEKGALPFQETLYV